MKDVAKVLAEVRRLVHCCACNCHMVTGKCRRCQCLAAFPADMPEAIGAFIQASETLRLVVMFSPDEPPANKMIADANKATAELAAKEYDAALAKLEPFKAGQHPPPDSPPKVSPQSYPDP